MIRKLGCLLLSALAFNAIAAQEANTAFRAAEVGLSDHTSTAFVGQETLKSLRAAGVNLSNEDTALLAGANREALPTVIAAITEKMPAGEAAFVTASAACTVVCYSSELANQVIASATAARPDLLAIAQSRAANGCLDTLNQPPICPSVPRHAVVPGGGVGSEQSASPN